MSSRKNNVDALAHKAALALPNLTSQLQEIAKLSDWPEELIDSLSVEVDTLYDLEVKVSDNMKAKVDNEEYGIEFGMPNAAIRPFVNRVGPSVEAAIRDAVLDDLIAQVFNG